MTEDQDTGFDFDELEDSFDFDFDPEGFFEAEAGADVGTRLIKPPLFRIKTAHWKNAKRTAGKITVARLTNGIHLCIHGSANLRSSGNLEQIMVQDSKEIYDFVTETNDRVIEKFKTINKSVRRAKLWHGVVEAGEAALETTVNKKGVKKDGKPKRSIGCGAEKSISGCDEALLWEHKCLMQSR